MSVGRKDMGDETSKRKNRFANPPNFRIGGHHSMNPSSLGTDFSPFGLNLFGDPIRPENSGGPLAKRFVFAPFTVLDARSNEWQDRKRAWKSLGIESDLGREDARVFNVKEWATDHLLTVAESGNVSIFDPVLTEICYRWFCPPGGQVIDPFAGGSVRGVVASLLGYNYWGCDLSLDQISANHQQAMDILDNSTVHSGTTPNQKVRHEGNVYWLKRDDLFYAAGAWGGKARTAQALSVGATHLVTAGSRSSPQVEIVARLAAGANILMTAHTPEGVLPPHIEAVAKLPNVTLRQHPAGYNSVISARARDQAEKDGARLIPFGMECYEAVEATADQVATIPWLVNRGVGRRLVVPVGSGMTLAGVLTGLSRMGEAGDNVPVLGVCVGAEPKQRLDRYAPRDWSRRCKLVQAESSYDHPAKLTQFGGVEMDAYYEAKCLPLLEPGDLLWVVGRRGFSEPIGPQWHCGDAHDLLPSAPSADFIFSCPPYGDLERYSSDVRDLSTMDYVNFRNAYEDIIKLSAQRLKPNRFACFVVGDFRDKKTGNYRGFVADTIRLFKESGLQLYNDAILLTPPGSLPIRVSAQFDVSRKMGKTHQNVLVFVKGDAREATRVIRKF